MLLLCFSQIKALAKTIHNTSLLGSLARWEYLLFPANASIHVIVVQSGFNVAQNTYDLKKKNNEY